MKRTKELFNHDDEHKIGSEGTRDPIASRKPERDGRHDRRNDCLCN
jgi:hypothetical protein